MKPTTKQHVLISEQYSELPNGREVWNWEANLIAPDGEKIAFYGSFADYRSAEDKALYIGKMFKLEVVRESQTEPRKTVWSPS